MRLSGGGDWFPARERRYGRGLAAHLKRSLTGFRGPQWKTFLSGCITWARQGSRAGMPHGRDVIVVAASAGGLQPLRRILAALPASLPAAVVVVLHVPATGGRTLSRILDRSGPLGTDTAIDGERFRHGRVYVAPPDRHLLVVKDVLRLSCGPRQHSLRPAADPLFRSAALYARARTSAVVLSGTLDDAALGSAAVERCGGRVLIQDPAEADCDSMPRSAIAATKDP